MSYFDQVDIDLLFRVYFSEWLIIISDFYVRLDSLDNVNIDIDIAYWIRKISYEELLLINSANCTYYDLMSRIINIICEPLVSPIRTGVIR